MRSRYVSTGLLAALWLGCSSTVGGSAAPGADAARDVAADIVLVDAVTPRDVTPVDTGVIGCGRNRDCPRGMVCEYAMGCDQTRGECHDQGCQKLPVAPQYCGCDGRTLQQVSACRPDQPYRATDACPAADAGASRYADAAMVWQSPGGFAGWGPAVLVTGDGVVRFWRMRAGFSLDTALAQPADRTERVAPGDVEALFDAWRETSTMALPHASGSSDCYPSVAVRLCARCDTATIRYNRPADLLPEMAMVWGWFAARFPADSPRGYCDL